MMFVSMGATTDETINEEAERQYMAKQVGKVELARFYKACADTLTPRSCHWEPSGRLNWMRTTYAEEAPWVGCADNHLN